MTLKTKVSHGENQNPAADDLLEIFLNEYAHRRVSIQDQINTFAALYIADKLDSIDTRLMHLVHQLEKRHE